MSCNPQLFFCIIDVGWSFPLHFNFSASNVSLVIVYFVLSWLFCFCIIQMCMTSFLKEDFFFYLYNICTSNVKFYLTSGDIIWIRGRRIKFPLCIAMMNLKHLSIHSVEALEVLGKKGVF